MGMSEEPLTLEVPRWVWPLASRWLIALLLLSITGCAGLLSSDGEFTSPPRSITKAIVPDGLNRWWQGWGDTELDALIERTLRNNNDVHIAIARLREAQARRDEVDAARLPIFGVQAISVREALPDSRGGGIATSHRVGLVASYEVDLWGHMAAQRSAVAYDAQAQAWALAMVRWSLVAQVAEVHVDLMAVNAKLAAAGKVRATVSGLVDKLHAGSLAGTHAALDLERARADLAATDSTIGSLQRLRLALLMRRALLSGDVDADFGTVPGTLDDHDLTRLRTGPLPEGSLEQSLQRRPDVQEALASLASRDAVWLATRRARWPQVFLSGDIGSDTARLSGLFSAGGMFWTLAQGLSFNLFDGGAADARTEQAQARRSAAQARYEQTMVRALLEVREAYAAMDVNRAMRDAQQRRVAALDKAVEMARAGYDAGALAQIELLDAQRQRLIALMALADSWRDLTVGQIAAFKALGAGHDGIGRTPLQGAPQHGERS